MADGSFKVSGMVGGLYESVRGFRYQFFEALADIVDNSLDAGAYAIDILTEKDRILIADDGTGMDLDSLKFAVTPWRKRISDHKKGSKGKYGIGLKAAAFSLANVLRIHTKTKSGQFLSIEVDLNKMVAINDEEVRMDYSTKETALWKERGQKQGTIVELVQIRPRKVTSSAVDSLKGKLGMLFFRQLEQDRALISVNGTSIEPIHPLVPSLAKNAKQNYYHKFDSKTISYKGSNGIAVKFKFTAAWLGRGPHWSNEDRNRFRFLMSPTKQGSVEIRGQGLYIMRNDRLITLGGWFGTRASIHHHHGPLRIMIEYSEEGDELIGIDHTKTKPEIDEDFGNSINQQYINEIFSKCEEIFRDEGQEIDKERQLSVNKKIEEKYAKPLSVAKSMVHEEQKKLIAPHVWEKNVKKEKELEQKYSEQDFSFALEDDLPWKVLWDYKTKGDKVTVLLNESHPGYHALFLEDDESKRPMNLCLFFYYLAYYESQFAELTEKLDKKVVEELKLQFKAFRRYVSKEFQDF